MIKQRNKELIRLLGINTDKPDVFQEANEKLMASLRLWAAKEIDLKNIIQSFFNINVRTKLMGSLLDLDLNNWIGIGASWQENNSTGQIRVDSKLTEYLLNGAFGASPTNQPFDIKNLNEVELNILQSFLESIETEMKKHWELDPESSYSMDIIYLVWIIESNKETIGRIAFGLPANFKPKLEELAGDVVDINQFANTGIEIPINFSPGKTKLTYTEIQSLEPEDLLIFEKSDVSKLSWHFGEVGVVLPEKGHPVFLEEDIEIEENMIENNLNSDKDPLTSLPLELSAEFNKVKIPLKQVLELKSGGVLPLGPLLETELTLTAQNKDIAKGELVIVGNQFGMRINEILMGSAAGIQSQAPIQEETPIEAPIQNPDQQEELPLGGQDDGDFPNFQDELKGLDS